jgi:NADPH:quinone reductase-like Zn-dependent oxidoreductase
MQWAKISGARVAITSSSDEKLARMKAMGADITINYRTTPDWDKELMAKTGNAGANVVLNTVGMPELERCLNACANNGKVMMIGNTPTQRKGPREEFTGMREFPRGLIMRDLTIKGIVVGSRVMLENLVAAVDRHKVKPVIDRVYTFEQALDAIRYMESGEKVGKIIIRVS